MPNPPAISDPAFQRYQQERRAHWDTVAGAGDAIHSLGGAYHRRLSSVYRNLVPPGQRVIEIGCGTGDLLASLQPSLGVGVDFSARMVSEACRRYPHLTFLQADAHELALDQTFDVVILSDLVNDLWDVQAAFERLRPLCHPGTRLVLNSYSRVWQPVLEAAQRLKLARPNLPQNWLTVPDIANLLELAGFEMVRTWTEVLLPAPLFGLGALANHVLVRLWPFRLLALTNLVIARPRPEPAAGGAKVSVIVPARNEAGNIEQIFARTPQMGQGTELVFVEGHSSDDTFTAVERAIAAHPEIPAQLHRQTGRGKGDAVRLGFEQATGDVLMILDADLTVPPEYLPRFYEALASGRGEFINGVRLVYPMEKEAMRFFNFLGNKFFSMAFSWLLGQPVKDTLCGTKVLWKRDYQIIAANRAYFGDFDPFGDFDLLFGAARQNRRIIDLPVRYRERTYGTTNISRWKHGMMLLRMVAFAAFRIKFV